MERLSGAGGAPGLALGTAVRLDAAPAPAVRPAGAPEEEQRRLDAALAAFESSTKALAQTAREKAGEHQALILEGQLTMLADPYLRAQLQEQISAGSGAEGAVAAVLDQFSALFEAAGDELTRQRAADVRDLRARLLGLLAGRTGPDLTALPQGAVLVVHELTPSMTAALDPHRLSAVLSETGGVTSHAAILARAMGLPAVLGIDHLLDHVAEGDALAVDGTAGSVLVRPDPRELERFQARLAAQAAERGELERWRCRPTATADGHGIRLYGNAAGRDAPATASSGGEGIGLYRSEALFLDRPDLPTEEEQFQAFRDAAALFPQGEVILRALDVGGDKSVPCLDLPHEDNPFLGYRAIRLLLDREDIFLPQLRAALRASAYGPVRLMLPLVSRLSELRQAKALLEKAKAQLSAQEIPFDPTLPVGIMVETPAAVLLAPELAREAAFFSIGTNDLTQYVMAADRGDRRLSRLGSVRDPAVLRAIRRVAQAGRGAAIPVGMCGEAAADPQLIPVWIGLGLDELSVSPSAILATRREIARWTTAQARDLAEQVLAQDSREAVEELLRRETAAK